MPSESRRTFLRNLAAGAALGLPLACGRSRGGHARVEDLEVTQTSDLEAAPRGNRMPILFVGHGSPMNVIEDNRWSRGFASLAGLVPQPAAILVVSAHWFVNGTYLTGDLRPRTIHDFSGFPRALYEIEYPAPGKVELAKKARQLLGEARAALSTEWGFDHGNWGVLRSMYPAADIPVVQLSIDRRLDARGHYELGRSLTELRHEGVLIVGSGNIVHNLRDAFQRMQTGSQETPDWARHFDETAARLTVERDTSGLLELWPSEQGRMAHPSPDHWLPLVYAYAASDDADRVEFPIEGFDLGSLSMRAVLFR